LQIAIYPLGGNNISFTCVYISSPPATTATPLNFIHKTDIEGPDIWGKSTMTGGIC